MPFSGDDDHQTLVKVAKADWDFDDECFDDLSHDAMEFIEGLLVKDPRHVLIKMSCSNSGILTYDLSTLTSNRKSKRFPALVLLLLSFFKSFLSGAICFLMMHIGTYCDYCR